MMEQNFPPLINEEDMHLRVQNLNRWDHFACLVASISNKISLLREISYRIKACFFARISDKYLKWWRIFLLDMI